MQSKARQLAFKISLTYILVGGCWILGSNELVKRFISDPNLRVNITILKGWGYVLVTGILLYVVLTWSLKRWGKEAERRKTAETGEQAAGEKLRQSEEQLRLVLDAAADGLWDWNLKTGNTFLSERYWEIIGSPARDVTANLEFFKQLVHPDDWPAVAAAMNEHLAGKSAQSVIEYRLRTADGGVKWIWGRGKVVERAPDGTPLRMVGTISDITARKQAETALHDSEERYRRLFAVETDAVFMVDRATSQILDANAAAEKMYGYSRDEFLRLKAMDVSAEPEKTRAAIGSVERHIPVRRHRRKDGTEFPVEISTSDFDYQGRQIHAAAMRDITERQLTEAAMRESEQRYRDLFEHMNEGVAYCRMIYEAGQPVDFVYLAVNEAFTQLTGLKDVTGKRVTEVIPGVRESDPALLGIYGRVAATGKPEKIERYVVALQMWFALSVYSPVPNFFVVVFDVITERKRLEAEMERVSGWLLNTQRISKVGGWTINLKTGAVWASPEACKIYGVKEDELLTISQIQMFPLPQYRSRLDTALQELLAGQAYDVEFQIARVSDGAIADVHSVAEYNTKESLVQGVIEDITERKRAELNLRRSQERYVLAERAVNDGLWDWNILTDEEYFSPRWKEIVGYRAEELAGHKSAFLKLVHPDDLAAVHKTTREHLEQGRAYALEFRLRHKDGNYRWVFSRGQAVRDAAGHPVRMFGAVTDITGRKRAEDALHASEHLLRTVIDLVPHFIFVKDSQSRHLLVNRACAAANGMTPEQMVGRCDLDFVPDRAQAEAFMQSDREVIAGGKLKFIAEERLTNAAGETRILQTIKIPFTVADAGGPALMGVAVDITDLKNAEAALRENEAKFRAIFNNNALATAIIEPDSTISMVNDAYCQASGYTREDVIGKSWQRTVLADDLERLNEYHRRRLINPHDAPDHYEFRFHHKNGEVRQCQIAVALIPSSGQIIASMLDVTVRKLNEEKLRESEADLAEGQRIARLGSWKYDIAGNRVRWSDELCRIFGMENNSFDGTYETFLNCVHSDDRARVRQVNAEAEAGGKSFEVEYRIQTRAGDAKIIRENGYAMKDAGGRIVGLFGTAQDITERKRAEEQMNLQFSALTAANAITITDRQGKIEWVNPAFTKLTGYTAEEAVGRNPRMLKSGQHPPAFYANLWATISTGNVWHGELVNKRKDGRHYTEDMTVTPVCGTSGQITHFVAIKQDVTERRTLENQLRQAQKMEAIGTLAGGIAHDFNNMLAAMFGYGYLLQQDTAGNAVAQEKHPEVPAAAGRAKELVQQILTFSRQREHKREVIHLDIVVKEATKFLRASLPADVKIEMRLAEDAPAVLADPTQIYQVTVNLATNALHAMEGRPGQLTIQLESFLPDEVFFQAHPDFHPVQYARLTVADTGHGMDAATLERIFEPFFTTKPVGKGTGLGLSVVHGIVQSHDGTITVESQPGQGTSFRLYFPAQHGEPALADKLPQHLAQGHGQKILLVDDEPALTKVFQRLLTRLQYQVTISNSAREAVRLFRENPAQFALAITDLTMPEMNGIEVARQLRAIRADLPVILASGFTPTLTQEHLREAGICGLLEKPVALNALAEVVQRALAET